MRYGVISDVHGNVHALEAVLRALERESLDGFVCPGDLVGYGPRPNECVERMRSLGDALVAVAGNHDLMAVGRLPEYALGPLPKRTLDWTRGVLGDAAREYLAALPLGALTADGVRVAHGSLDDPTEYVADAAAARSQLRLLGEREPDARVLLVGHTHLPMARSRGAGAVRADGEVDLAAAGGGPWLLNPGSVGQSRERRALARSMVLDTGRGTARFLALEYDARATRRELRDAGLPAHACHLAPGRAARWRRRLGARLAR
jgi:predicted phosphodiesterase